ncbi:hypothetical protein ASG41_03915 [Modestobacter sp. Leaf380]|nr:hypothetical protein ASG41_03915 [Modestobacter sp. Leaf380]
MVPQALDTHLADLPTAAAVTLRTGGSGVVLGTAPDGGTASIALFRPEPTTAVAVGGLPLAQLLAFRALAVGAQVSVETRRPAAWQTFANLSPGATGSIVLTPHADDDANGSVHTPRLLVVDAQSAASAEPRRVGRWSTVVTAHDQLSSWSAPLLGTCDLSLLLSPSLAEARLAASALNLPDAARQLAGHPATTVVVAHRGGWRTVEVAPTDVERWLIGGLERR